MNNTFAAKNIVCGGLLIGVLFLCGLFAPVIARHDPQAINVKEAYTAPCRAHPFGTDSLGRDLFSRVLFASRIALTVGVIAVGIATAIGIALGAVAGYMGGRLDSALMRFTDIMLCFPTFLILAVVAVVGPGIFNIMAVIGLTSWMGTARLMRAEILSLKTRDFVLASRAAARSGFYIVARHLIPNGLAPVLVNVIFGIAGAVLTEASLSFLGLGVQPPTPSWGNILMEGKDSMGVAWWITVFPGISILFTVLAFNVLGEGLRDILNPRLRNGAFRGQKP